MAGNLLINLFENWPKYDIGEGAFMALFGFLFVFLGIVLLILIFTGLGKIMAIRNVKKGKEHKAARAPKAQTKSSSALKKEEGVTPELLAVISAAIAAYYEDENVKCDFVVRRIKKL